MTMVSRRFRAGFGRAIAPALLLVMAASPAMAQAPAADKVMDQSDVPTFVNEAINGTHLLEKYGLKHIVYGMRDGKMAYDVEFERADGPNPRIRVFADGKIDTSLPPADQ